MDDVAERKRPFVSLYAGDAYSLFLHKFADPLAKTAACHGVIERRPERAAEFLPFVRVAQENFTRYVEECMNGWHPEAPPEFVACAQEVYEKSRADWAKRDDYFAFEKWLAERFP